MTREERRLINASYRRGEVVQPVPACETCANFRQHYTMIDGAFVAVGCGHCAAGPRVKHRNPVDCCDKWLEDPHKQMGSTKLFATPIKVV